MKIQTIINVLKEIQEEDNAKVNVLKQEYNDIFKNFSLIYKELEEVKNQKEKYEKWDDVLSSNLKKARILCPYIEILLLIMAIVMLIINPLGFITNAFLLIISVALFIDITYNINVNYKSLHESNSVIKRIVEVLKIYIKGHENLKEKLAETYNLEISIQERKKEIEDKINKKSQEIQNARNELSFVKSHIYAIEYLASKDRFDELTDDNQIVGYVNKRLNKKVAE